MVLQATDIDALADYLMGGAPDEVAGNYTLSEAGTAIFEYLRTITRGNQGQAVKDAVLGLDADADWQAISASLNGVVARRQPPRPEPDDADVWQPKLLMTAAEQLLCARSTWLDDYIAYGMSRTDAPMQFHEAVGLVVLSAMVGRRAVLRLSQADVYANLWIMLLAESTIYRKSTCLDIGREMLDGVDTTLLAPNDFTPQRFVAVMAERDGQPVVVARDEFGGFYEGINRLEFMIGAKDILCDLYDGRRYLRERQKPRERKKKDDDGGNNKPDDSEWRHALNEPFLSIMAGTTSTRFIEVAKPEDINNGFLPRFSFEMPPPTTTRTKPQPITERTNVQEQTHQALVAALQALRYDVPTITLGTGVLDRFNTYQADIQAEAFRSPNRSLVGILGDRTVWKALKNAMLLACAVPLSPLSPLSRVPSKISGHPEAFIPGRIELPHLLRGIEVAERWRHTAIDVMSSLGPSKFEQKVQKAVILLKQHPGILRRDIIRTLRLSAREMAEVQDTLVQRGEMEVEPLTSHRGGEQSYRCWPIPPGKPKPQQPAEKG